MHDSQLGQGKYFWKEVKYSKNGRMRLCPRDTGDNLKDLLMAEV